MSTKPKNFKSVIPVTVFKKEISRDINYYALKQKLKSLGFDFFNYVKPKKEINESENTVLFEIGNTKFYSIIYDKYKKFYFGYYQEMNLVILSCWFKYCKWWNGVVNNGRKEKD